MTPTAADRSVFFGFGAWVGSQRGATKCRWWPDDPNEHAIGWDRNKLIEVDLDRNPEAVRRKQICRDEIEVDDKVGNGGMTRLGPSWPTGSTIDALWLESKFWERLPDDVRPARSPRGMECHDYELTSVLYWSGPLAGRRFFGFHAEITAPPRGTMALCTLYPAGRSKLGKPEGTWWLDLAQVAHPYEIGYTQIGIDPQHPKKGALYIDSTTASNLRIAAPKIPPLQGSALYPR